MGVNTLKIGEEGRGRERGGDEREGKYEGKVEGVGWDGKGEGRWIEEKQRREEKKSGVEERRGCRRRVEVWRRWGSREEGEARWKKERISELLNLFTASAVSAHQPDILCTPSISGTSWKR